VILLLGALGAEDLVFCEMQSEMLLQLDRMLTDRQAAQNLIASLGGPDQSQRTRLLHILQCGISPCMDPFLFSCCQAIRSHHLYALQKKARIFVENGVVLMGGIDESKLVPKYCVFFQIRKKVISDSGSDTLEGFEPFVGPVMATKVVLTF
jgi:RNA-dependent RNA polymerase